MTTLKPFSLFIFGILVLSSCLPRPVEESVILPGDSTIFNPDDFVLPVSNPIIVSRFGQQGSSIALQSSPEAEVRAVQAGVVTEMTSLGVNDGFIVSIRHVSGLNTSYLNLKAVPNVVVGDEVIQGQSLGFLGGGILTPPNVLKFFASTLSNGSVNFINPAPILGLE